MKAIVIYKKSVLEIYRNSPDQEVREFVAQNNEHVQNMIRSDCVQAETLERVLSDLEKLGAEFETIYRANLVDYNHRINDNDLIISVGGDGTFLEVSHYADGSVPVLGVNSDPERSVGFYCYCTKDDFAEIVGNISIVPTTTVSRLQLVLNGNIIPEPVLNDILIAHQNPAATARYTIDANGAAEKHKDSGLLVCSAMGSTAWMYNEGGIVMPLDSRQIQYLSRGKRNRAGRLTDELKICSLTREGKIYHDGEHLVYNFGLGSELVAQPGKMLTIIGDLEKKRMKYI